MTFDVSVKCVLPPAGREGKSRVRTSRLMFAVAADEAGDRLCNLLRACGAGFGHPKLHPQQSRLVLDARAVACDVDPAIGLARGGPHHLAALGLRERVQRARPVDVVVHLHLVLGRLHAGGGPPAFGRLDPNTVMPCGSCASSRSATTAGSGSSTSCTSARSACACTPTARGIASEITGRGFMPFDRACRSRRAAARRAACQRFRGATESAPGRQPQRLRSWGSRKSRGDPGRSCSPRVRRCGWKNSSLGAVLKVIIASPTRARPRAGDGSSYVVLRGHPCLSCAVLRRQPVPGRARRRSRSLSWPEPVTRARPLSSGHETPRGAVSPAGPGTGRPARTPRRLVCRFRARWRSLHSWARPLTDLGDLGYGLRTSPSTFRTGPDFSGSSSPCTRWPPMATGAGRW